MSTDSENDSGAPLISNSRSNKGDPKQNLAFRTADLTLSKNSFEQMLMNFNKKVINNDRNKFIKAPVAPITSILKKSKPERNVSIFNPTANSTPNLTNLSANSEVSNSTALSSQTHSKKKKKRLSDIDESQSSTVIEKPKKSKKRKRLMSESDTETIIDTNHKLESSTVIQQSFGNSETFKEVAKSESLLEKFEQNNNLTKSNEMPTISKDLTSSRYDTFLIQIPKSLEPKQLIGVGLSLSKKIRLKCNGQKYDCIPEPCKEPATLLSNNRLSTIHPKASITIKQHIKRKHVPEACSTLNNDVAFPDDLKERHPLFGADYAKSISLEEHIRIKLKAAVESNERRKEKEAAGLKQNQLPAKPQEEIFKLLNPSVSDTSTKKPKKSKNNKNGQSGANVVNNELINEILFSKTLEISNNKKKRKHKKHS